VQFAISNFRKYQEKRMASVTLVNCFKVPAGREDEFFGLWQRVNAYMQTKRGYLEHKLHRAAASDSPFQFVNVACWESAGDFYAAHDDGFRALVNQPEWKEFHSQPGLYEVIHEGKTKVGMAG
jgi:heme-degrading monooxygenase HmoA